MELAKTNLERAKELYAADVVAKELLDTRNCEMLSSNAVLASAEAKVRNAKLNLEYTSIRAPMSGKISEALVDIGNLIVADSTLLTRIVDDSSVQAYFELSERDVVAYRDCGLFNKIDIKAGTGPTVSLRLFEHKDKTYNGVLNYYDNEISSESASLTMRADFDNSKRQLSLGMDVKKATKDTMDHVQNALIAITLVLSAVFVPTAFVEGISGQFYKQFALTIAVSTILSGVVSLTLSPALCVMLIKNNGEKPDLLTRIMNFLFGKFFKIFNRSFDWVSEKYGKAVHGIVRHWVLVIFTYVILLGLTGYFFSITPSGFIPKQDNDFLQISVQVPDGYSLGQTDKVMRHVQFVGGRPWNHLEPRLVWAHTEHGC